jgi:hypothetical protein
VAVLTGRSSRFGVPTLDGAAIPEGRASLVAAVAGIWVGSREALPSPRWGCPCPYEGRRLPSIPCAGGAERLVELGILVSMVNVLCARQRMVARMDFGRVEKDERENKNERENIFALTGITHCNRLPQPSRYQHHRLDRWCY